MGLRRFRSGQVSSPAHARITRLATACAVVGLLAFARPGDAQTTYNVSTVADLTAAIDAVNAGPGGDSIVLAPGTYAITQPLIVDQDVTLKGDPASPTVLDGGSQPIVVLDVKATNISLANLTVRNAYIAVIYEGQGVLTGTGLTITGMTYGIYPGDSSGSTVLTNSTLTNNSQDGLLAYCADLQLTNVTLSDNGTGVYFAACTKNRMQINNALIVRNGVDCGGFGGPTSFIALGTNSFDSDGSCAAMGFPGLTTVGLSALDLGTVADNGGPTLTEAIGALSAAVNAGDNPVCPAVDQRGFLRSDGACDIGAFERGAAPAGSNTPSGTNVLVAPAPGVSVTFSQVTGAGNTTASTGGPLPPTGFQIDGVVYDISTTSTFTGSIAVCLPYSPTVDATPRLFHYEDVPPAAWVDRTVSIDPANHVVCARVSSLSPFAVMMPVDVGAELQHLQVLIDGFNLRKHADARFTHRVDELRRAWVRSGKPPQQLMPFCRQLAAFTAAVRAQSGIALTVDEANQLLDLLTLVAGQAACGP